MCSNYSYLSVVFDRYKSYSPYDMQESIRKEVKGDLEKSFLTLGKTQSCSAVHISIVTVQLQYSYTVQLQSIDILVYNICKLKCLHTFNAVQSFENKQLYFANRLNDAMKVTAFTFFPFLLISKTFTRNLKRVMFIFVVIWLLW